MSETTEDPARANTVRPSGAEEAPVSLKTWFTVWGSVIGAFIAVLNIMITNSSLKDIQGALSATPKIFHQL